MFSYYTFEGPIICLDDNSGILERAGLTTSDRIRYTFLINREMEGTRIENDGSTHTYDNDRLRVYFYTDLINGSRIQRLRKSHFHRQDSVITYNRGFESDRRFDLLSGSNRHYVNIWGVSIKDCQNGARLHGLECMYDKNKRRSVISSKLSLISISNHYSKATETHQMSFINFGNLQQLFQT